MIRNLSGGYRQRVGIAQAIIHKPRLVVMDEPTNGLDPNQLIEARKLIREIGQDRVVLLSSHIMSEIHLLCKGSDHDRGRPDRLFRYHARLQQPRSAA
ncbi:ATP-binding cassette domain-containing protein [Puia sp. P3]|uniref:ATP-binding cassette domain-containing protein n=1 Tax=Puia sp. P3 TaxID=3423952 RepID=UPI003D6672D7